jgi:uncharacterized protein (DUF433 family)
MKWQDYIITDENILAGKPILKGTRLSVEHIINLMASGWDEKMILDNYPRMSKESLQAIFSYVKEIIADNLLFSNDLIKSA